MGKKDNSSGKSGDGVVTTTVHKGAAAGKAGVGALKSGGEKVVNTAKAPLKKKGKHGSDSSSEEDPVCGEIAPDCFRMVSPIYLLVMFLVIALLGLCALDPEDCELIPGVGGFMRDHAGWVGLLFYGVVVLNAVLATVAVKHCTKFHLTKKTTAKWFGQTMVAGYPSLKMLKEMEIQASPPPPASTHAQSSGKESSKKK